MDSLGCVPTDSPIISREWILGLIPGFLNGLKKKLDIWIRFADHHLVWVALANIPVNVVF